MKRAKVTRKVGDKQTFLGDSERAEHKVKIPFFILLGIIIGGIFLIFAFFGMTKTDDTLPDYMTTKQNYEQDKPIIKETQPTIQTPENTLNYFFETIINGGWFKFILLLPAIIIAIQIFFRARRWMD